MAASARAWIIDSTKFARPQRPRVAWRVRAGPRGAESPRPARRSAPLCPRRGTRVRLSIRPLLRRPLARCLPPAARVARRLASPVAAALACWLPLRAGCVADASAPAAPRRPNCRSSCAGARNPRPARPRDGRRRRRRVPPRRRADPRRPAELRPGRGPGAAPRQRAHQPRRQRLHRPRAAAASCSASRASSSQPTYHFGRTGAGGHAERIDFLDEQRAVALRRDLYQLPASTTRSMPRAAMSIRRGNCSTRRLRIDFEANEGIAEGAVLRFYGVPILAAPVLSFPLTDARKSGWLPPSIALDSHSGLQVAAPYYWNIAPNRDATLTPRAERAPRRRARQRVPLPRAALQRQRRTSTCCRTTGSPARAAMRWRSQHDGTLARARRSCRCACCASPTTTTGRTSRQRAEPDAAPAAVGSARQPAVAARRRRRLDHLCARAELAGAADRRPGEPDRGAVRARCRRSARAPRGARRRACRSASRPNSTASPIRTA